MTRIALSILAIFAAITLHAARPVDVAEIDTYDVVSTLETGIITFDEVEVTIEVTETGTVTRTHDPVENVTEVYNEATGMTTTAIVFDQPLHISG